MHRPCGTIFLIFLTHFQTAEPCCHAIALNTLPNILKLCILRNMLSIYIFSYFSNVCEALEHHFAPCFPHRTIHTATGLVTDSSVFSVYLRQFSSVSHQVFCDGLVLMSSLFVIIGATHDSGLQCPLVCLCRTKLYSHRT